MSPEFSAATSKTRRRLEVFAELWFEERPTHLPHLRRLSNVIGSRTKRAPGGADFRSRRRTVRVASSGARAASLLGRKWGHSSVGRALEWHSRGQGFELPLAPPIPHLLHIT